MRRLEVRGRKTDDWDEFLMSLSGVRCYRDDRNHSSLRSIIQENPAGTRCFLLGVCPEDFSPIGPFEGSKFVGVQRRMTEVGFKKPKTFPDGLEDIFFRRVVFNLPKVSVGLGRENQFMHWSLFDILGKGSAFNRSHLR